VQRAGVPSQFVDPRDVELTDTGGRDDAVLPGVAVDRLHARFAETFVLVVPGFLARNEEAGLALLREPARPTISWLAH
jgi:aspartokinase